MSRWVRGIYNSAANFNMSKSLRAAAGRFLDRDDKHVRKESDESNQHVESNKSSESTINTNNANATCTCVEPVSRNIATYNDCRACNPYNWNTDNPITTGISESVERDYADYTASIRTEGQGAGSWIRVSNEPRNIKQTSNDSTNTVEQCTGIPTGVTV